MHLYKPMNMAYTLASLACGRLAQLVERLTLNQAFAVNIPPLYTSTSPALLILFKAKGLVNKILIHINLPYLNSKPFLGAASC